MSSRHDNTTATNKDPRVNKRNCVWSAPASLVHWYSRVCAKTASLPSAFRLDFKPINASTAHESKMKNPTTKIYGAAFASASTTAFDFCLPVAALRAAISPDNVDRIQPALIVLSQTGAWCVAQRRKAGA